MYQPHIDDAARNGIRLISYDRPGYGGSTSARGRRMVDTAADVAAIADFLRLPRMGVWGTSGGGAPALACAAALPGRVVAAASLAGTAPYPAEGLDYTAGMGELNVSDFQLLLRDRAAWERKCVTDRKEMLEATPEQLREGLASLLSDVDRSALTPEVEAWLNRTMREGFRSGEEGARDDGIASVSPWGFEVGSIHVPVQIWHGSEDRFVPLAHGQWLAAHVPGAEAHLLAGEGHVSLLTRRVPDAMRWIAAKI